MCRDKKGVKTKAAESLTPLRPILLSNDKPDAMAALLSKDDVDDDFVPRNFKIWGRKVRNGDKIKNTHIQRRYPGVLRGGEA